MGARLRRQAQLIGEATIQGRLYSLGRYPGAVATADAPERVHGELYELDNPQTTLKWLDAYEGIVPGDHDWNDYERTEWPVRLDSGGVVTAWVYLYRKDVRRLAPIPDGRWQQGKGKS